MKAEELLAAMRQHYPCGAAPALGPGSSPAVLVVDFVEGFTHPDSPLAGPWDEPVGATASLIDSARSASVPVIFSVVEFDPADLEANLLIAKAPRVAILMRGSRWGAVDHRLQPRPDDWIISKKHGSAFFGTDLAHQLEDAGIDTVLLAGCVTSGCVRATAVDASQHGFRPVVVREAVGDRSPLANEANLLDIAQRYGDVLSLAQVQAYLTTLVRN